MKYSFLLLLFLFSISFAEDLLALKYPKINTSKVIFGRNENIIIYPDKLKLNARLDTGAKMSSIDANNAKIYERDGKKWVEFYVKDPKTNKQYEFNKPLLRYVKIKKKAKLNSDDLETKFFKRPVVTMTICLGNQKQNIQVNLSERGSFLFPVLLGRDTIIKFNGLIDPSLKNIRKPNCDI